MCATIYVWFVHRTTPQQGTAVPTPKDVAAREPLLPPPFAHVWEVLGSVLRVSQRRGRVCFGVGLHRLHGASPVDTPIGRPRRTRRAHGDTLRQPYVLAQRGGSVLVALEEGVGGASLLQAYCHARLVADGLQERVPWLLQHWDELVQRVTEAGWEVDRLHLGAGQQRWRGAKHD